MTPTPPPFVLAVAIVAIGVALIVGAFVVDVRINSLEAQLRANGHHWMCQLIHDMDHPDDPRYDRLWCEHPDNPNRTERS